MAAILVVVILTAVILPWLSRSGNRKTGAKVPDGFHRYCLDVSHYNDRIVWDSLLVVIDAKGRTSNDIRNAREIRPISRVVIKATEGTSLKDSRFQEYWEAAGRTPIQRGAYHFFRTSADPREQARNFIATVRLRHSDLPPVLDIETIHRGCSRKELNEKALQWLQAVGAHYGRTPVIYTSDAFARDYLGPELTRRYPLWIARYHHEPPRTEGWSMWQFSDKAIVYGVHGHADLSVIHPVNIIP